MKGYMVKRRNLKSVLMNREELVKVNYYLYIKQYRMNRYGTAHIYMCDTEGVLMGMAYSKRMLP